MAQTAREMITDIQTELYGDVPPTRACELLARLTALLGNCSDEVREAEMDFTRVYLQHLESEKKANRAKIRAEASPEYLRKRVATDTHHLVVEMIRSLKVILKSQQEEMRLAR